MRERVCVSVLSHGGLVERFFFRFEKSTNLIEKERRRKRKSLFFRNEKEEEERKKE